MKRPEVTCFYFRGIKINNVGLDNIHEVIANNRYGMGYVCLTEVRNVITATRDKELRDAINGSLLSIADGTPLAWFGRLSGCRRIQRVAGFDLLASMLEADNGFKHFLLGDTEDVISKVIAKAKKANGNLRITGYSPPFKEHFSEDDNNTIFDNIKRADPDIVWVSLGGGKQEKWMHQNLNRLERGTMAGVGAAYRFYIGQIYVPPKVVQKLGLQWLFRMMGSSRVFHMMIRTHPKFCFYFPLELWRARRYYMRQGNDV